MLQQPALHSPGVPSAWDGLKLPSKHQFPRELSVTTTRQTLPMAKGEGKERKREWKEKGLCFHVESSSPLLGLSQFDLHNRSMMPCSMGWTMPKRGLWEGSPSQQASINCQHSSSNTGRRSGRAPRGECMEIRPRGREAPVQHRGRLSSQARRQVGLRMLRKAMGFGCNCKHLA